MCGIGQEARQGSPHLCVNREPSRGFLEKLTPDFSNKGEVERRSRKRLA